MSDNKDIKVIMPQAGFQEKFVRSNVDVVIGGGILGGGKLSPLYSKILTPDGWTTMGELKIGQDIVTPFNGVQKIKDLYPQGIKSIYKVTTMDGRTTEVGAEHLWEIRTQKQLYKYRINNSGNTNYSVLTTSEISEMLLQNKKVFIPLANPFNHSEKDFLIDPYLLGILIGDGCLMDMMPNRNAIFISNSEQDIIDKIAVICEATKVSGCENNYTKVFTTYKAKEYYKYLDNVGLLTYSYNRFIPEEYIWGSIQQRLDLLKGLMDSDGYVENNGSYVFTTTSERLKTNIITLCRSLGYIATYSKDKRTDKYTSGECFKIVIQTYDEIFSSKKHLSKINKFNQEFNRKTKHYYDHIRIKSIEYIGEEECQCLYIDDKDHLYITDDYIVTHNTYGAILSVAEPCLDSEFRAIFTRRNLGDLKTAGSIIDDFKSCYGNLVDIKKSDSPVITFPSKAFVECRHIADENPKKITEIWKGVQTDMVYFDELTSYDWFTFSYIMSRVRGKSKWTGKIRATTNPKRNHWCRIFLDWYIGADGFIIPERDGVIRYFYVAGERVEDVVWGSSKEEVYEQCKSDIDKKLKDFPDSTYKNIIKSFVFYKGSLAENKALLDNNPDYIGNVAATGGRMAQALMEGNWNIDADEDTELPLPRNIASKVFQVDPQTNGDRWITADLADYGTDNMVALAWDGFHIIDMIVLAKSTPKQNAQRILQLALKHDVGESHIIYDATNARYMSDYIPESIPYISGSRTRGMDRLKANKLKDECFLRFVKMTQNGGISVADNVARMTYYHQNVTNSLSFQEEFIEECGVVQFQQMGSGKVALFNKKEMNAKLGRNRSMDLIDPVAMRMLPILHIEHGSELFEGIDDKNNNKDDYYNNRYSQNIYEDSFWA